MERNVQAVVVIGQGYVGLPVAMRAVAVGHTVTGIDLDERRASALAGGVSFVEDIPSAEVRARSIRAGTVHSPRTMRSAPGTSPSSRSRRRCTRAVRT